MTEDFSMIIDDVFSITGVGTLVSGKVQSGSIKVYDKAEISGIYPPRKVKILAIRTPTNQLTEAHSGDTVSLVLAKVGLLQTKIDEKQIALQEIIKAPH